MKELSNSYVTDKGNVVFRNVSGMIIRKFDNDDERKKFLDSRLKSWEDRKKAWEENHKKYGAMYNEEIFKATRNHYRCESIPVPAKPKRNIWKTISILLSIGFYTYWVIKLT